MARRVVLQNTGMSSTKYGSLERYLVRVVQACRDRGYGSVMQYESTPSSDAYVRDLTRAGAHIEVISSRGSVPRAVAAFTRLVLRVRPAVIHNHFVPRSWEAAAPVAGRLIGAKVIVKTIHSDPGYRTESRIRHIYDHYDHILPVSDAVRVSLEKGGVNPARLQTFHLGLFGDRRRSMANRQALRVEFGLPPDALVLGCIAFEAPVKGVDMLLHALKLLNESHWDVYLLQVGVDPRSNSLPDLARDLGLARRVVWAGIVDDGWRLLNAVDAYVQPSRSEGLPFGLMEAMAMRLPIVCTDVSGNVEAIVDGESGLVSRPDPDSLAAAIQSLLEHPERWVALGDAAWRRYRERFDGEVSVDRLVTQIYRMPQLF